MSTDEIVLILRGVVLFCCVVLCCVVSCRVISSPVLSRHFRFHLNVSYDIWCYLCCSLRCIAECVLDCKILPMLSLDFICLYPVMCNIALWLVFMLIVTYKSEEISSSL